jgi:hypothetical protein
MVDQSRLIRVRAPEHLGLVGRFRVLMQASKRISQRR